MYGWDEKKGRTEEIIGNWFAKGGERRDKVVLATKVYGNMAADGEAWPNHDKLSALNIRRAVDASLKRLRTDHIDLYQFHHIDRDTSFDEIFPARDRPRRPSPGRAGRARSAPAPGATGVGAGRQ
ncbi:hypothetical protein GCM10027073_51000 [Streptomyces chlorus]